MAACTTTYAVMIAISPLPLLFIDRDRSGLMSIEEVFNAIDIGTRTFEDTHPGCVEYYWLKDNLTAYMSCPDTDK